MFQKRFDKICSQKLFGNITNHKLFPLSPLSVNSNFHNFPPIFTATFYCYKLAVLEFFENILRSFNTTNEEYTIVSPLLEIISEYRYFLKFRTINEVNSFPRFAQLEVLCLSNTVSSQTHKLEFPF